MDPPGQKRFCTRKENNFSFSSAANRFEDKKDGSIGQHGQQGCLHNHSTLSEYVVFFVFLHIIYKFAVACRKAVILQMLFFHPMILLGRRKIRQD